MGKGGHESLRELQRTKRSSHVATCKLNPYRQIDALLNMQARERERTAQG
jgi:hypothetical protein